MKKVNINSKNLYKAVLWILAQRGIFLIVFFGAILIYSFDVIYNNAYIRLQYIDYSNSAMIFDGRKESVVISKITDSLRQKDAIIKEGLERDHKNIFVYEDSNVAVYDKTPEVENISETPVIGGTQTPSGEASANNEIPGAETPSGSSATPQGNIQ